MKLASLCLLFALACQRQSHLIPVPAPRDFPALPDTIYTLSGATPVYMVDSIMSSDSTRTTLGQYWALRGHVYISRVAVDPKLRRKVLEHERCHVVLHESGLALHALPWYVELLCDAFANARVAELERTLPRDR